MHETRASENKDFMLYRMEKRRFHRVVCEAGFLLRPPPALPSFASIESSVTTWLKLFIRMKRTGSKHHMHANISKPALSFGRLMGLFVAQLAL
jgi:hypothetical protein